MEREFIKSEEIHKIFVEYFTHDENGMVQVQTRKFTNEDKADYFIGTLPQRGVTDCSKKVISKIAFHEREYENILDMVKAAAQSGRYSVSICRQIKPHEKELFRDLGLIICNETRDSFKLAWTDMDSSLFGQTNL